MLICGYLCSYVQMGYFAGFLTSARYFEGVMKTTGESPSGRKCPVEFGLRVSSCQPRVLQVVAETQSPCL